MKKEFWIKKDPVKDGQDNWKKLSSYEFARFMETADGKLYVTEGIADSLTTDMDVTVIHK